jgi:hypothetical protein
MSKQQDEFLAELLKIRNEITEIMDRHSLSYVATQIDNHVYSDRPVSTTYLHFQLREPMSDYRAALQFLRGQLERAQRLDEQLKRAKSDRR